MRLNMPVESDDKVLFTLLVGDEVVKLRPVMVRCPVCKRDLEDSRGVEYWATGQVSWDNAVRCRECVIFGRRLTLWRRLLAWARRGR